MIFTTLLKVQCVNVLWRLIHHLLIPIMKESDPSLHMKKQNRKKGRVNCGKGLNLVQVAMVGGDGHTRPGSI